VRLRGSREEVVVVVVVVNRGDGRPEELYGPNLNKKQRGIVTVSLHGRTLILLYNGCNKRSIEGHNSLMHRRVPQVENKIKIRISIFTFCKMF
jgi:hypothetical protein